MRRLPAAALLAALPALVSANAGAPARDPTSDTIPSSYLTAPLPAEDDALVWKWGPGLRAKDGAGNDIRIGGRIFVDYSFASADGTYPTAAEDGVEFRRARMYMQGSLASGIFYKTQIDFAGGDADFKDVFLGSRLGNGKVQVGHFKQPLGLEQLTSSKYITFLERGPALGTGRDTGIMYAGANDEQTMTYAVGMFQPVGETPPDHDGADEYHLTGRVTYLPSHSDDCLIHLGLAASQRHDSASFSHRPSHFFSSVVGNADPGDDHTVFGVEAAGVWGPLSVQSEVMTASGDDLDFFTVYAFASYFLTEGDHRAYSRSSGAFGRVQPVNPIGKGGKGAVEVALRFDTADFDQDEEITDVTAGVNWYLTSHTRIMANAITSTASDGPAGADEGDAEIFLLRFQTDF